MCRSLVLYSVDGRYIIADVGVGRTFRPGPIVVGCLVVPTVLIAVPPAAARALAVPSPEAAFGACWSAGNAVVTAHVVPSALVARADEGSNPCRDALRLRCTAGERHCRAGGGPEDGKAACRK